MKAVSESLDSLDALRMGLAYLRCISWESQQGNRDQPRNHVALPATMSAHLALLYAALVHYRRLAQQDARLRHDGLEEILYVADRSGLMEKMRQFRNSVFHIRPSARFECLLKDVLRLTLDNKLALNKIERLLYEATETAFRNPEAMFGRKQEELESSFQAALDYYRQSVASGRLKEDGEKSAFAQNIEFWAKALSEWPEDHVQSRVAAPPPDSTTSSRG